MMKYPRGKDSLWQGFPDRIRWQLTGIRHRGEAASGVLGRDGDGPGLRGCHLGWLCRPGGISLFYCLPKISVLRRNFTALNPAEPVAGRFRYNLANWNDYRLPCSLPGTMILFYLKILFIYS